MADAPVEPVAESVEPIERSAAEQENLDTLYAELQPLAREAYIQYFLARTPAAWQDDMKSMISDDIGDLVPEPLPPESVVVTDGGTVAVLDALDVPVAGSPATLRVEGGVLMDAKLTS